MRSGAVPDRETVIAAYDELDAAFDKVLGLSYEAMTDSEKLGLQARMERNLRRAPAVGHQLVGALADASPAALGATNLAEALATRLRISKTEAKRRIRHAELFGPRTAITGEPLPPTLAHVAAAQQHGQIGSDHLRILEQFFKHLPSHVDYETREQAEIQLVDIAAGFKPEELRQAADRLALLLDQDGPLPTDADRARKRFLTIDKQGRDGMSKISGLLDPELRATIDAVFAKLAAPGMCNPEDEAPCVDGEPSEDQVHGDMRSQGQRNHDALKAGCEKWHCSAHLRPGGAAAQITWACSTYGAWSAPSSCPTSCRRPVRTWQCPRSSGVGPFCRRDRSIHRLRARILRQR